MQKSELSYNDSFFVFNSYIELTIKDYESLKRVLHVTYELADIYPCTPLPSMIDSFWKSN